MKRLLLASALATMAPQIASGQEITVAGELAAGEQINYLGVDNASFRREVFETIGLNAQGEFGLGDAMAREHLVTQLGCNLALSKNVTRLDSCGLEVKGEFGGKVFFTGGVSADYHLNPEAQALRIGGVAGAGVDLDHVVIRCEVGAQKPLGDVRTYGTANCGVAVPFTIALKKKEREEEEGNGTTLQVSSDSEQTGVISLAEAKPEVQAEYQRLMTDIKAHLKSGNWDAVDRKYEDLLALGVEIDADIHSGGATGAMSTGDVVEVIVRLERAQLVDPNSEEPREFLRNIQNEFRRVSLEVNNVGEDVTLIAQQPPFNPFHVASIDFARKELMEDGDFEGLLPHGGYTLNGNGFTLDPGFSVYVVTESEKRRGQK